jgi:FAD synthetase
MSKKSVETKKSAQKKQTRIMVFGTFDGLHKGHLNFFKQAKNLTKNSFLIVSIARDRNVFKIKGKQPILSEGERMNLVGKNKSVNLVVLSGLKNHIPHIVKMRPDIIALGYDQKAYVENLKKDLENKDIFVKIMRLKPYKERIYKNHLIKNKP